MPTLTVEDGSGADPDANSYATLAAIRAYNDQRAVTLPVDDDAVIALATTAIDFLESWEDRWKGNRALPLSQPLSWPRSDVYLWDPYNPLANNVIPKQLIAAQCYLAGIAVTVDLSPVIDSRAITKEVIGPLETDYSTTAGAGLVPIIPLVESILRPLMRFGAGTLRSLRV